MTLMMVMIDLGLPKIYTTVSQGSRNTFIVKLIAAYKRKFQIKT